MDKCQPGTAALVYGPRGRFYFFQAEDGIRGSPESRGLGDVYKRQVLVLAVAALNGAAEEVYFRGVLYQTVARTNPVLVTTTVYALVTAGTRNVALVLAAVVMGFIFARQRRVAGGLLAPVVTHLAWSL